MGFFGSPPPTIAHGGGLFGAANVATWFAGGPGVPGNVISVAIIDLAHWVGLMDTGDVISTADGGFTWQHFTTPFSGGGSGVAIASNGSSVVAVGSTPAAVPTLIRSIDTGATWSDVTPGGETPASVQFLPQLNAYIALSGPGAATTDVLISIDGAIWSSSSIPAAITAFTNAFAEGAGKLLLPLTDTTNGGIMGIALSTDSGHTWSLQFEGAAESGTAFSVIYNGSVWNVVAQSNVDGKVLNATSPDALNWTERNRQGNPALPPYRDVPQVLLGNSFITAAGFPVEIGASSDNGLTFSAHAPPNPGGGGLQSMLDFNGTLLLDLSGVISSADLNNWQTELTLASGQVNTFVTALGLTLAGGIDDSGNATLWRRTP
jgi:hypothetical protein